MGAQPKPQIGWDPETMPANFPQLTPYRQSQLANLEAGLGIGEEKEKDRFNPLRLFSYLIRYRWIVAACLLAGLLSGVMYTWLQTPMYRSTAKMEIAKSSAKVLEDIEVTTELSDMLAFETARQKILSRDLARRVVFELNLAQKNEFLAPTPKFSLMNLFNRTTGTGNYQELENLSPEQKESLAIAIVGGGLEANLVRNSSIMSIKFSHPVASYTAQVANQVAKSYMDQNIDAKNQTSDLARQFIQERVLEVKKKLEDSEKALVNYAEEAGLTAVGDDKSLIAANIAGLNKMLTQSVDERLAAERYVEQLRRDGAASLPQVFESKSIQAAKSKLVDLQATYQQKLATLKPGFPEMRKLQSQINEVKRNMQAEIASIGRSVTILLEQAKNKDSALRAELVALEQQQREYERKSIRYTILKREADSNSAQYQSLIGKLSEVGIGAELKNAGAAIVDEGQVPFAPYSPRLTLNVAAAVMVFAAFGVGLICLFELLNNTFAVPDQIESELKIPTLGIIPRLSAKELEPGAFNSASSFAEAYRTLRTSVQFTGTEGDVRNIVVTSPGADEGKTTTSVRLATDFAALGRKVLIVDGDLRKPSLHRLFNVDNAVGLSNLLSNVVLDGDTKHCFKLAKQPNLTILTAGTIPPNPADLLASPRMSVLLEYLTKEYDMIIIDSPPIMGLSDAPIFSRLADATLVVVACKQTKRQPAQAAIGRLNAAGGNVVGAVLTKFRIDPLDYNSSYRYMQNNYYTYGETVPQLADSGSSVDKPSVSSGQYFGNFGHWLGGIGRRFS